MAREGKLALAKKEPTPKEKLIDYLKRLPPKDYKEFRKQLMAVLAMTNPIPRPLNPSLSVVHGGRLRGGKRL